MADPAENEAENESRRQLVWRIVASKEFCKSAPLQEFLLFITEKTFSGRSDEIKEQTIGSQVLRKGTQFDPATDNIVRVRARQLRQKLDTFFRSEGADERMRITIPPGSYVPRFESLESIQQPPPATRTEQPSSLETRTFAQWLPWTLVVALAISCLLLASNRHSGQEKALSTKSRLFWQQIFAKGAVTEAVVSDMGASFWQKMANRELGLSEYIGARFDDSHLRDYNVPPFIFEDNFVSLSVVTFLSGAVPISQEFGAKITVKSARQASLKDFKFGNVIVMGARPSNPWMQLFESRLHYYAERLPDGSTHFRSRINSRLLSVSRKQSYAVIALLRNLNNTGNVLLIEGLGMEATDGAIEFLLTPQSCSLMIDRSSAMGLQNQTFEAFLEVTPVSGGSADVRLIELRRPVS